MDPATGGLMDPVEIQTSAFLDGVKVTIVMVFVFLLLTLLYSLESARQAEKAKSPLPAGATRLYTHVNYVAADGRTCMQVTSRQTGELAHYCWEADKIR